MINLVNRKNYDLTSWLIPVMVETQPILWEGYFLSIPFLTQIQAFSYNLETYYSLEGILHELTILIYNSYLGKLQFVTPKLIVFFNLNIKFSIFAIHPPKFNFFFFF